MSRSNGPLSQMRGLPPQQWPLAADQDPAAQQGYAPAPAPARYPAQQGYAPVDPGGQHGASHASPGGYQATPSAAPQGYYPTTAQNSYQPVFDRYAAPAAPAQRGYDPRSAPQHAPAYAPPQQPSVYDSHNGGSQAHQAVQQAAQQHAQQRAATFEQWQQPTAAPAQSQPPRGYDFTNYAPPAQAPVAAPRPDYGSASR
jgi:hypothetical protein